MLLAGVLALVVALGGCASSPSADAPGKRVLVLGFDGLDPKLLRSFMDAGDLPNFAKLASRGSFGPLRTTMPPQSPVAWSTFITGRDPGGHGIYDFIHRDPAPPGGLAILPYLSTSRVEEEEWSIPLGRYTLPIQSGETELLRRGKAFWNVLVEHGVPATIVKIPANFPPEPSEARTLSDMGTPDVRGTYGTFFLYTGDPADGDTRNVSGGVIRRVQPRRGHVRADLPGPPNPFLRDGERATTSLDVFVDAGSDTAKIEVSGREIVLRAGEWSGWVPVSFDLVPGLASVAGIVKLHLAATKPYLRLYVSPVNMDPSDPALPISTPPEYAAELQERVGYYYTQGLPEDTAALSAGALDDDAFLEQEDQIWEERMRLLETELARFRRGLLFVYFGGADQVSHMLWRATEADHPAGASPGHEDAIREIYRHLDTSLGRALEALGPDGDVTVIVLSDHGFASFRRAAHLNSWLRDQGWLRLRGDAKTGGELFRDVDWVRTRAYGLGLNGLYLNLRGRERYGIVSPAERERIVRGISEKLLEWRDPDTGDAVVERVYRREEIYSDTYRDLAPDLMVGYSRGYRVSDVSALGEIPEALIEDNVKKWSGDHCIAHELVPGVLLANRAVEGENPGLEDVAPTVLTLLGVPVPEAMTGKPFLR